MPVTTAKMTVSPPHHWRGTPARRHPDRARGRTRGSQGSRTNPPTRRRTDYADPAGMSEGGKAKPPDPRRKDRAHFCTVRSRAASNRGSSSAIIMPAVGTALVVSAPIRGQALRRAGLAATALRTGEGVVIKKRRRWPVALMCLGLGGVLGATAAWLAQAGKPVQLTPYPLETDDANDTELHSMNGSHPRRPDRRFTRATTTPDQRRHRIELAGPDQPDRVSVCCRVGRARHVRPLGGCLQTRLPRPPNLCKSTAANVVAANF